MLCGGVLVVEDDDGIREAMRLTLEVEGYQAFTASNGKEALELLPKLPPPCLILLDLMMPVMDGWSFSAEIDKSPSYSKIPRVVVTACAEKTDGLGHVDGVIKKPVDVDLLLDTVQKYCDCSSVQ